MVFKGFSPGYSTPESSFDGFHRHAHLATTLLDPTYLLDGVQHRGVVTAAEVSADLSKGEVGVFAGQVHAYLTGNDNGASALLGVQIAWTNIELLENGLLDLQEIDTILAVAEQVRQCITNSIFGSSI